MDIFDSRYTRKEDCLIYPKWLHGAVSYNSQNSRCMIFLKLKKKFSRGRFDLFNVNFGDYVNESPVRQGDVFLQSTAITDVFLHRSYDADQIKTSFRFVVTKSETRVQTR